MYIDPVKYPSLAARIARVDAQRKAERSKRLKNQIVKLEAALALLNAKKLPPKGKGGWYPPYVGSDFV